ncbi:MAG: DUF2911 domain-containing protein [Ignavibacteriales bacterium]|nr:DUF2911 domain-containing protein [Ignavibacteriales bacterium]
MNYKKTGKGMNIFGKIIYLLKQFLLTVLLIGVLSIDGYSQKKEEVRISPKATVKQTVGFTNITIDYGRPGVKGRTIWGGLVPYNAVWRAGANEATKITFASDVRD